MSWCMKSCFHSKRIWAYSGFWSICISAVLFLIVNTGLAREVTLAEDEVTEKRLNAIVSELRCLVCQNESLAASHAELARDLRQNIRIMIQSEKSDDEIMSFMVDRYGDFVRYRPPLKGSTLLLWFGPALLFLGGIVGLFAFLRRQSLPVKDEPLSETERQQVEQLFHSDKFR